jgi:4-amino-4-deoxy-L-arabinose transferase-like glycosyltransferase
VYSINAVLPHGMLVAAGGLTGTMLGSLPLAAYLAIFWVLRLRGEGWRSAALGAAVCWGLFLALVTEILSVPRLITRPALSIAWLTLALVVFAYGWVLHRSASRRDGSDGEDNRQSNAKPLDKIDWVLLSGIGLLIALVGGTAILSAPNTWDAMAYHMSRVAQWMTNRDVNLYPTFYSAQLFLAPWAEYAILHIDILYGGDRLANLVELFSMIGTVTGVSLIAQEIGASRRGQLLAAVTVATLPEGVLEASGAMNTYVGAFWIVVAVYYLLRWNARQSWAIALAIGSAVGLSILTKGTAFMFLPCVLLACWWMGSALARKRLLIRLPVLLVIVLALNGPLFVRNYRLSGSPLGFPSPLGDDPERQYANSHISASIAVANVVKNLSLHFATPIPALNRRVSQAVVWTLNSLHIDPNDKASTYRGGFHLNNFSSHEARAGNPLQLVLLAVACLLLFSPGIGNRTPRLYMLGLAGSFVLFCALVRWQPWNSRYHLPLFALGMALVGVVLERSWNRFALSSVACVLLASALPFAVFNSLRPLASWPRASILRQTRQESYFADSHDQWAGSYVAAANLVESSHCNSVGVDASLEDFDYPLFALLGAAHGDREVTYAGVRNLTAAYARPRRVPPCAVVCLRCANAPAKWAEYEEVGGRVSVFDELAVFTPDGNVPNNQTVTPPQPSEIEGMLERLDHYRESPRAVNLTMTEMRIDRAGRDWPKKKADLRARLNALYTGGLTLWRVRDSVDPLRRRGELIDHSRVDRMQLLAASEVFANWDETIQGKVDYLNGLVDQLYLSWESQARAVLPVNGSSPGDCRVAVKTVETHIAEPASDSPTTTTDERPVEIQHCSCLGQRFNEGRTLARKQFGRYDSEAENLTKCVFPRGRDGGLR